MEPNKFLELVKNRYSVRQYDQRIVEPEILQAILSASQAAPTAVNNQPQRIFVCQGDKIEKLKAVTKYIFNAPVYLLVGYDDRLSWKHSYTKEDQGPIDATIVMTHLMLAATAHGLGTCWIGSFSPEQLQKHFELDEHIKIIGLLSLGYPSKDSVPSPKHQLRKNLTETVTYL